MSKILAVADFIIVYANYLLDKNFDPLKLQIIL